MTERNVSALIRGTIFVRDLKKSSAFYSALGFNDVYYEGSLTDKSACSIIGHNITAPLNIRILKSGPGPNYGMIGLFQMDDALKAEAVPMAKGPARIGEVALIFYVRDFDATLEALRANGATYAPEPELFVMPHRAQREVCYRDPDGILLNLVENHPSEQEQTGREG